MGKLLLWCVLGLVVVVAAAGAGRTLIDNRSTTVIHGKRH